METFGSRVAAARKAAGLTQEKLAQDVGVALMTISRYERNALGVDDAVLVRLAERLGKTPGDLRYGAPAKPETRSEAVQDLPPRLLAFLELVPVTEGERRHLIQQVASDGAIDLLAELHRIRTPERKRTPEAPAIHVEVPDDAPRARPAKRR